MLGKGKIFRRIKKMNHFLLLNALSLLTLSLISIYSTTSHRTMTFFTKEAVFAVIGVVIYFVFSLIDYKIYAKYTKLIYGFNVLLLLSVFAFGVTRLGAKRWINLGFMVIQPSEISKLLLILTFSEYVSRKYSVNKNDGFKKLIVSFFHVVPIFLLIAAQPDLGTSLTLIFIYGVIMFISGINWPTLLATLMSVVAFIPFAYFFLLKEYQKKRVLTFLNPEADKLGTGWNVTQSKIAIGSGGLYGKGFFQSTQSKLRFLPESHTDFIGSVFLEETGTFGGLILLGLYLFLILQIINVGDRSRDEFGRLVCYGIAGVFIFHAFVNLGMIMGIMPVTGLPLLFMSYGGSSLLFSFTMLGIVQSIRIYNRD